MEDEHIYDLDIVEPTKHELVRRGDSFDIGSTDRSISTVPQEDILIRIVQNPSQLQELLGLTEQQTENIRAVLIGAGAGAASKYLGKHFGHAVAGGFGGFVSGLIADKIMGIEGER